MCIFPSILSILLLLVLLVCHFLSKGNPLVGLLRLLDFPNFKKGKKENSPNFKAIFCRRSIVFIETIVHVRRKMWRFI